MECHVEAAFPHTAGVDLSSPFTSPPSPHQLTPAAFSLHPLPPLGQEKGPWSSWKMSYAYQNLFSWSRPRLTQPHLLFLSLGFLCCLVAPAGVSAEICRVTGGVLGIHWSSVVDLGWRPLAVGRGSASCWESCCLEPACNAVWSLGGTVCC